MKTCNNYSVFIKNKCPALCYDNAILLFILHVNKCSIIIIIMVIIKECGGLANIYPFIFLCARPPYGGILY